MGRMAYNIPQISLTITPDSMILATWPINRYTLEP